MEEKIVVVNDCSQLIEAIGNNARTIVIRNKVLGKSVENFKGIPALAVVGMIFAIAAAFLGGPITAGLVVLSFGVKIGMDVVKLIGALGNKTAMKLYSIYSIQQEENEYILKAKM